jgi:hypothetical protein
MSPNYALRRAVYEEVKAAGNAGLYYTEVHTRLQKVFPEVTLKAVHGHLSRLHQAEQVTKTGRGHYLVDEGCAQPGAHLVSPQDRLLELIADCPGGVSDAVLAEDAGLSRWQVGRYLIEYVAQGQVRRVQMPATHGGGWGYAKVDQPEIVAAVSESPADGAQGAFELLDKSRLAIAWDGARIVLPPAVTRGLLRYLDALGAQAAAS